MTVSVNRVEASLMERCMFGLKVRFIQVMKWSVKERKGMIQLREILFSCDCY